MVSKKRQSDHTNIRKIATMSEREIYGAKKVWGADLFRRKLLPGTSS